MGAKRSHLTVPSSLSMLSLRASKSFATFASRSVSVTSRAVDRPLRMNAAPSRPQETSATFEFSHNALSSGGGKRDDEDFLKLVTAMGLGFDNETLSAMSTTSAADLTKKCASTPQLVAHLSKMMQEPKAVPQMTSVSLHAVVPTSSLHWPSWRFVMLHCD